ncbi:unnamed protein product [Mytilus coruscus]|uniref:Ig-like domain-containing protein n=1 Tax=Mytilus coruscus TaxID=42192 RepID=A0A6J8BE37_MYTCO|nr:unnamed protein product [Mytilus coruscus]
MNRILVILYCAQTVALAGSINKIYWTIKDFTFICERNVTLFCNTSAVGFKKTTWMKQSDVILHHGLSFQPEKYSGKEVNDGSSLIIINATESDFNTSYTSNFICLPHKLDVTWTIIGRTISIHLNLKRFFPVPKCRTKFGDDILITNQQEFIHLQGAFFHGRINITSQSGYDLCGGNLSVVCLFRGYYSDVIGTKYLQDCNDTISFLQGSDSSGYGFGYKGAAIRIFILFIILFVMVFYHFKKSKKSNQNDSCEEGQPFEEADS